MNGAYALCRILERCGVEHIFGLFGDIQTEFAHAVSRSKISWIGVHNEKSGGFMADIYARVSGKVGVVFSTLGPGATNLTSALANATADRSPVVGISDHVYSVDYRLGAHQFVDLETTFGPKTGITKATFVVRRADELERVFVEAFQVALTEPCGAVHVSVVADVFTQAPVSLAGLQPRIRYRFPQSTLSFEDLATALTQRTIGLVIAGGSIERAGAAHVFQSFIEKQQLPVLTSFRGKNVLPADHPFCLGTISRHLSEAVRQVIYGSGSILAVGYDYNEGVRPSLWGEETPVFNLECFDNRVVGVFEPPSLFGDLRTILTRLSRVGSGARRSQTAGTFKRMIGKIISENLMVTSKKFHPGRIIDAVNRVYRDNSVIVCDVGLNKYYSGLLLEATPGKQILFSNGQSAMAFSSGALGAKLAAPDKDVVVLVGDGGFLMNPQEVLTAVLYKRPVVWVVFNDGGLGLIGQAHRRHHRRSYTRLFSAVDFKSLAFAFGIYGERVEAGHNVEEVLRKVKAMGVPALIDVPVRYTSKRTSYRALHG